MAKAKRKQNSIADLEKILEGITPVASMKTSNARAKKISTVNATARKNEQSRSSANKKAASGGPRAKVVPVVGKNVTEAAGQYLGERNRANNEAQALSGKKPPEEEKSLFQKGLRNLLRGQSAAANAFKEGFDPNDGKAYDVGAAFKGFGTGFNAEKTVSYSDILKEHGNYGSKKSKILGGVLDVFGDPTTYLGVGLIGKAGKATKYVTRADGTTKKVTKKLSQREIREGLEESADVARKGSATPFNLPSGKAVGKKDIIEALAVERAAVSQLGKRQRNKLSPEARELFELAKATQKAQGKKYKRLGASESAHLGKKTSSGLVIKDVLSEMSNYSVKATQERLRKEVEQELLKTTGKSLPRSTTGWAPARTITLSPERVSRAQAVVLAAKKGDRIDMPSEGLDWLAQIGVTTRQGDLLMDSQDAYKAVSNAAMAAEKGGVKLGADGAQAAAFKKEIGDEVDKRMAKLGLAGGERALREQLIAATNRNLSTTISNQLSVRVGTAKIGVPGVAALAKKSAEIAGKPEFIRKSVKMFEDGFRANAHIPPSIRRMRRVTNATGAQLERAYGRQTQSVFDGLGAAERKRVAQLWGKGLTEATVIAGGKQLDGTPVDDVFKYIDEEIESMSKTIKDRGVTAKDLASQLPDNFIITQDKIIEKTNVLGSKGLELNVRTEQSLDTDFFKNGVRALMKDGKISDPGQALYIYNAAINKVIANKKLWETVAQSHGAVLREKKLVRGVQESLDSRVNDYTVTDRLGRELVDKFGWKTPTYRDGKTPIQGLENHVFEPEIADAITRMGEMYSSAKSTGDILRNYDKSLVAVKSVLTKYNPSFHPRTFLGEYILGFLGGMRPLTQVDSYKKSIAVWRGHSAEFMGRAADGSVVATPAASGIRQGDVEAANLLKNTPARAYTNSSKSPVVMKFRGQPLNADELRHYYMKSGLKSGFASTDTVRGTDATLGGSVLRGISDSTQAMTESIEDIGRMAHFIDVIRHSKAKTLQEAIDEAAETVAKTHLDYTEITKLERDGMSRVVPFYKWLRLSTPLMAETLLTQPGKALVIPKALDTASRMAGYDPNNLSTLPGGPDAAVPEYLLANGARPVGSINGNSQWFNPVSLFPIAGSAELLNEGQKNPFAALMNTINPALGGIAEVGLDAQNKGAAPSDNWGKFAASQTPQTNFVRKLFSNEDPSIGTGEKTGKFLLNPGLISTTPRTIEGAARAEREAAYTNRRETKRKLGILEPKKK